MGDEVAATFHGYIHTTYDALIIFEACLSGKLEFVPRKLMEGERWELVRSGNVFIYDKKKSGISRWTDGISWSPSRVLDNFLIYRQLERPFKSGERKQGNKNSRKTGNGGIVKVQSHLNTNNEDRALIGSLVDSYDFKRDGLVKKTISITLEAESYHLVCYYKCEDVKCGLLTAPSQQPALKSITPRTELMKQNFKVPIDSYTNANGFNDYIDDQTSMDYGYNPTVIQHVPMDYHPGPIVLHYTHQQPQLAHMQLQQHKKQQATVSYYLPDYSEKQQEAS